MKQEYILKHKNREVLYFEMNNDDYEVVGINKIIDAQRLPFYVEDKNNIVEYAVRLGTWIKSRGLSGSRKDIYNIENVDAMIAIDFFIGNEDRHRGNFGILRNADTLDWVKLAPIFDNGNSLFYDKGNETYDDWGLDTMGKAFGDSNRLQLALIGYPEWYNSTEGNNMIEIIVNGLKCNERLTDDRIDKIAKIVSQRKSVFESMIEKINVCA
jgi:hypothetical protein